MPYQAMGINIVCGDSTWQCKRKRGATGLTKIERNDSPCFRNIKINSYVLFLLKILWRFWFAKLLRLREIRFGVY
jgi:hypothetical protein